MLNRLFENKLLKVEPLQPPLGLIYHVPFRYKDANNKKKMTMTMTMNVEGYDKFDPEKWRAYLSALIKSMRRGLEDDAIYWGVTLQKCNKTKQAWRRILIHVSEDVGPAEPNLPANIRALYENWKDLRENDDAVLSYIHAISLMARATKSRIIDHAKIVYCNGPLEDRPVPDYAFDHHGSIGREMGRGVEYFFEVASQLHPLTDEVDPYRERAKEIALENERKA